MASIQLLCLNVSLFHKNNKELTSFLKNIDPDIICLQEVTRRVDVSAIDEYISEKAIDTGAALPYSFFAPNWALKDFRLHNFHGEKDFSYDFGGVIEYGNYMRSRYPILQGESVFVQKHFSYITDWETFGKYPGEEPRNVQVVDLQLDTKNLRILNYHGIWSNDKKGNSTTESVSKKLLEIADGKPAVICGDG